MATPGTPGWLRTRNDQNALHLLLEHGALTRSRLSDLSGLSKPTAGQMLSRLHAAGLVAASGSTSAARGPRATTYAVRPDSATGVAMSIVDEGIDAVLVDPTDAEHPVVTLPAAALVAHAHRRSPTADVRAAVAAACEAAGVAPSTVHATVIGVQAAVADDGDMLSHSTELPGWPVTGARTRIAADTGLATLIENDANLAARAERHTIGAADLPGFVYVWLGQGLDAGIDIGGDVYAGAFHSAGEVGYLDVPQSAAAFAPAATDFAGLLGGDAVVRMLHGGPGARLRDVLPRLHDDDDALDGLARRVEPLVSTLMVVIDPAAFFLGGPTGSAGGTRLAELVQARVAARRHPRIVPDHGWAHQHVDVRTSASGPRPILQGARTLLVAQLRARLESIVAGAMHPPTITER